MPLALGILSAIGRTLDTEEADDWTLTLNVATTPISTNSLYVLVCQKMRRKEDGLILIPIFQMTCTCINSEGPALHPESSLLITLRHLPFSSLDSESVEMETKHITPSICQRRAELEDRTGKLGFFYWFLQ